MSPAACLDIPDCEHRYDTHTHTHGSLCWAHVYCTACRCGHVSHGLQTTGYPAVAEGVLLGQKQPHIDTHAHTHVPDVCFHVFRSPRLYALLLQAVLWEEMTQPHFLLATAHMRIVYCVLPLNMFRHVWTRPSQSYVCTWYSTVYTRLCIFILSSTYLYRQSHLHTACSTPNNHQVHGLVALCVSRKEAVEMSYEPVTHTHTHTHTHTYKGTCAHMAVART